MTFIVWWKNQIIGPRTISSHLHDDVQKRFSRRCSMQSWAWKKPMLNSRFGPVNFILDPQYRHWNNWSTKSGLLKQCYSIYVLPNQRCSVGFCQWTGPLMATWNLTKLTPLTHCNHGWCKKPYLWRQWSSWRNHSFPIPYAVMVEMAYSSSVYKYYFISIRGTLTSCKHSTVIILKTHMALRKVAQVSGGIDDRVLYYINYSNHSFLVLHVGLPIPQKSTVVSFLPLRSHHRSVAIQVALHHLKKHQVISSPFFGDTVDLPHTQ